MPHAVNPTLLRTLNILSLPTFTLMQRCRSIFSTTAPVRTLHMMCESVPAYQLQIPIDRYITSTKKHDISSLVTTPAKWCQIACLRELLLEFAIYTVSPSEHTGTTTNQSCF